MAVDAVSPDRQAPQRAEGTASVYSVQGVTKSYGSTRALDGVDLNLMPGRVHALLGENGAGKSSLVRILVGADRPTSGIIEYLGAPVTFRSTAEAIAAGIIPIYQQLSLFPQLTVLENLFSFDIAARGRGLPHLGTAARDMARESLAQVGLDIDPGRKVSSLSLGERQLLEIARALQCDCRVLLLDEPTAALNAEESGRLLTLVRKLADRGVAAVYVSHKSAEIRAISDDITVLRDGRSVIAGTALKETSVEIMIEAMLGHSFEASEKTRSEPGDAVLTVTDAVLDGRPPISLDLREGEILGIVLHVGAGTEELAEVMAGSRQPDAGTVKIAGVDKPIRNRRSALEAGIGYVPPDRHAEGLFQPISALGNASASSLPGLSRFGILSRRRESGIFRPWFASLGLSPMEPDAGIGSFSGGNQQKVLLSRNLGLEGLRVLILAEPTRGIDVKARDRIHQAISEAASEGCAIALVTSDLEELAALAHRTLILHGGAIAQVLPAGSTPDEIGTAIQGGSAA